MKFEHECYDVGHLYNLAHCVDRGLFKPPMFLQIIFGILGLAFLVRGIGLGPVLLAGALILGEHVTSGMVMGGALILIGVVTLTLATHAG